MIQRSNNGTVEILLVEDNPGDVRLAEIALAEVRVNNRLSVTGDGVEAMNFLRRTPPYENAPRPDLVLLDWNLPRMDGRQVLREMKSDADLRRIPVVVLTTSRAQEDIRDVYALNGNSYVHKPVDFDSFLLVMQAVYDFWLGAAELPPG